MFSAALFPVVFSGALDPEVAAWRSAIVANGGSVSGGVVAQVNRFVRGCKADGVWDTLLDVGLFAGVDNLSAALVKLKTPAGVQRVLTNNNFVSADYIPFGGPFEYLNAQERNFSSPGVGNWTAVFGSASVANTANALDLTLAASGASGVRLSNSAGYATTDYFVGSSYQLTFTATLISGASITLRLGLGGAVAGGEEVNCIPTGTPTVFTFTIPMTTVLTTVNAGGGLTFYANGSGAQVIRIDSISMVVNRRAGLRKSANANCRLETGLIASTYLSVSGASLGIYASSLETTGTIGFIGVADAAASNSPHCVLITESGNTRGAIAQGYTSPSDFRTSPASASTSGFEIVSRTSSTSLIYYRNGAASGSANTVAATSLSAGSIGLFSLRYGTGGGAYTNSGYSSMALRFYHIGLGLTAAQVAALSARVNTLMTAFGANVY